MKLRALQQMFFDARSKTDDRLLSQLVADRKVAPEPGLSIYRNAYHARLVEALENDQKLLARYLGDALWPQLCTGFIGKNPSPYSWLRNFGDRLPAYLRRTEPLSQHPEIAELAQFERALLDCFDAPDATEPGVAWGAFAGLAPEQWPGLQLRLVPSLQLLSVRSNGIAIWRGLKAQSAPPKASLGASLGTPTV